MIIRPILLTTLAAASFAASSAEANEYHAWISAGSNDDWCCSWDVGDNVVGLTYDSFEMRHEYYANPSQYLWIRGTADLATWSVSLGLEDYGARNQPYIVAALHDWFTIGSSLGPQPTGSSPTSLYMDIHYSGSLKTWGDGEVTFYIYNRWYGETGGGARWGEHKDFNGTLTFNLCAYGCPQYGMPFELEVLYTVSSLRAPALGDFLGTFSTSFRSNDPNLTVSSLGGYTQPVPEPESWVLLLAGLSLVGWVARHRG